MTAPELGEGLGLPPGAGEPAGAAEGSDVPPGAGEPTGAAVVVRPGRREEIAEVLGVWREAGSVPSVSDDPASLERLLATSGDALLLAEAERRLAAKGARRLSAIVMSEHDPAVALWLAAGYHHDTRVGRYVRTLP